MKNNCSTFAEIKGFEDPNDEKNKQKSIQLKLNAFLFTKFLN